MSDVRNITHYSKYRTKVSFTPQVGADMVNELLKAETNFLKRNLANVPRTIPALIKAFRVMELFLQEPRAMTVPEIVERLKLPRTSAHEIVNTLVTGGYLYRDGVHHNKFFLGSKLFELGSLYAASFDLFAEGGQFAEKISAICDETVQMAVLEGTEALFVARADCSKMVRIGFTSGLQAAGPLHGSGENASLQPS